MTRRGLVLCALGTGVVLAVAAGLAARVPEDIGGMTRDRAELYIAAAAAAGALYAAAAWQVLRGPAGHGGLAAVLGLALAMRALTLLSPPLQSTDIYRYVWDGRVQLSGTSPYRYTPLDDRLARLRDPFLFPGLGPGDRSGYPTEPLPTTKAELLQPRPRRAHHVTRRVATQRAPRATSRW